MNKLKLFLENFIIYGFGSIISKIVPVIMLPVVTRIMPDSSYFGMNDMSGIIVSFGSSIALMGLCDAMYRLFFDRDDEEYKKQVCSTAVSFVVVSSIIIFTLIILGRDIIAKLFFKDSEYSYIVCISAVAVLVSSTDGIISAPTRMQNKRKIYLVINTVFPVLSYTISILLLMRGYYAVALPLAFIITEILMEVTFFAMNRKWFTFKKFRRSMMKELLAIGIPVMPVFLCYWLFQSCDRLMIGNALGMTEVGIYSISAKLGNISQLIYMAFAGGWQYFAFSTMKELNQVETNSRIFEYLGIISFVATMGICTFSYPIFKIFFPVQYLLGYIAAPYLFLAPLLLMLYQVIGNQFLVIKKTWYLLMVLLLGTVANVLLNWILIPILGIEGAAIGTLMGYVVTLVASSLLLVKKRLLVVSKKFLTSSFVMLGFLVLWRTLFASDIMISFIVCLLCTVGFTVLYREDLIKLRGEVGKLVKNE